VVDKVSRWCRAAKGKLLEQPDSCCLDLTGLSREPQNKPKIFTSREQPEAVRKEGSRG